MQIVTFAESQYGHTPRGDKGWGLYATVISNVTIPIPATQGGLVGLTVTKRYLGEPPQTHGFVFKKSDDKILPEHFSYQSSRTAYISESDSNNSPSDERLQRIAAARSNRAIRTLARSLEFRIWTVERGVEIIEINWPHEIDTVVYKSFVNRLAKAGRSHTVLTVPDHSVAGEVTGIFSLKSDTHERAFMDLYTHIFGPDLAERERWTAKVNGLAARVRDIEQGLSSTVPIYDPRCGGDGILSPNQRSIFTSSEERDYQEKLRQALATVPTRGTHMNSITIEVRCTMCTRGITGHRRASASYASAARAHLELLQRSYQKGHELTIEGWQHLESLHNSRGNNYPRDAALAFMKLAYDWTALMKVIDESDNRLRYLR